MNDAVVDKVLKSVAKEGKDPIRNGVFTRESHREKTGGVKDGGLMVDDEKLKTKGATVRGAT